MFYLTVLENGKDDSADIYGPYPTLERAKQDAANEDWTDFTVTLLKSDKIGVLRAIEFATPPTQKINWQKV